MQASELHQTNELRPEPVLLGLRGLSGAIAAMGNLAVTVDGVPDAARLSAGHFLGDGVWSVAAQDLDGLTLYPSPGRNRNCRLSIRLRKIDKDMGDAISVGAVYVDVDADSGRAVIAGTDGAISLKRKDEEAPPAPRQRAEESAFPESSPDPFPRPTAEPPPAKRTLGAAPANPPPVSPAGTAAVPGLPLDIDHEPVEDEPTPAPDPFSTETPQTDAFEDDSPWPSSFAGEPADPVAVTPPGLDDLPVPVPPAPGPQPARTPPEAPATLESAIVPVRVAPGLRMGRFGKTGRPEDVVAVRGRGASRTGAGSARSGSIVFVRD